MVSDGFSALGHWLDGVAPGHTHQASPCSRAPESMAREENDE